MTKKLYRIIGLILVLGAILAATLALGFSTGAATTNDYSFIMNYDISMCEKIILSVNGEPDVEMVPGTAYNISKQKSEFKLTFEMKVGYEIEKLESLSRVIQIASDQKEIVLSNTEDQELTLTCKKREYQISYDTTLSTALSAPSALPTSYTYGQEGFQIPNPTANGYIFKGWRYAGSEVLLKPAEGASFCELSPEILRGESTIHLVAEWDPKQYYAYRLDHIYRENVLNNIGDSLYGNNVLDDAYYALVYMGATINGSDFGEVQSYPGFKFYENEAYYTAHSHVVTVAETKEAALTTNYVYRLYEALKYDLKYYSGYGDNGTPNFGASAAVKSQHTFNDQTSVPNPTRVGYTFTGWTITVTKGGQPITFIKNIGNPDTENLIIQSRDDSYAGDEGTEIVLTARWAPKTYEVQYEWGTGVNASGLMMSDGNGGAVAYVPKTEYVYDTALAIPNPIRVGYNFIGWLIGDDTDTANAKTDLVLDAETYPYEPIILKAVWEAKTYTVTLDGNGGAWGSDKTVAWPNVTYDALLPITGLNVPTRVGYTLVGFYNTKTSDGTLYIKVNADGTAVTEGVLWDIDEQNPVLYAVWVPNQYGLQINVTRPEGAEVTVTVGGAPYDPEQKYDYDSQVEIKVTLNAGYKVTANDRDPDMAHASVYEFAFVMGDFGAADTVINLTVLPVIANPFEDSAPEGEKATVDYVDEKLQLPNGIYHIVCGEEKLVVVVTDDGITVNGEPCEQVDIPDSFFGKRVEIVKLGEDNETADSDAVSVLLAARPTAPNLTDGSIAISTGTETAIGVAIGNPDPSMTYEFAVATNPDGIGLVWRSLDELTRDGENYLLDGLNPGTNYYVYVRVSASNADGSAYPHGQLAWVARDTDFRNFYSDMLAKLDGLMQEGDGEMVKALIEEAKINLNLIAKPSATFYDDVNRLYDEAVMALPVAREQDARLKQLSDLRQELIASGGFSDDNVNLLNELFASAERDIKEMTAGAHPAAVIDAIIERYEEAVTAMKKVEVEKIASGDMTLTAGAGLPQGTTLNLQQIQEYADLVSRIDAAIAAGKVELAGTDMTVAEAVELLRTLDVMAAYSMNLSGNYNERDGNYTLRLKLPEELLAATGLQVAYYNDKTGMLEVLPTARDGLYLEFTANRIANFVILGDPTVDLSMLIIALGLILACQLIAVILIAARRSRRDGTVRASIAFPIIALTVRFLPQNGLLLVPILGAAVVIMQIVLMVLLLSSNVVHKSAQTAPKPRREKKAKKTEVAVMAEADDFYANPAEQDGEQETEDPFLAFAAENGGEANDAEAVVYEDADEELIEDEDNEDESTDVFVNLATGEVFGDTDAYEDFIEPAANPRYSLPDEEFDPYTVNDDADEAETTEEPEEPSSPEAYTWDYDAEAPAEDGELTEKSVEEDTEAAEVYESVESEYDPYEAYDDSVRGEPAEDLPQEEPVTGELPEYERRDNQ